MQRKVIGQQYAQNLEVERNGVHLKGSMQILVLECGHLAFCNPTFDHRQTKHHACGECARQPQPQEPREEVLHGYGFDAEY